MKYYLSRLTTALKQDYLSVFQILTVLACVAPFVKSTATTRKPLSPAEIEDELKNDYIIPDVISTVPKHRMNVQFEDEGSFYDVEYGTYLTPRQSRHEPKVDWPADNKRLYTLLCVCPDVPNREEPDLKDWLQWQVVNIHGSNVSSGHSVNVWHGPGPTEASGEHRYVFLVYQQQPDFKIFLNRSDFSEDMWRFVKRMDFNTESFVRHFNLGDPWASNFFLSSFNNFKLG